MVQVQHPRMDPRRFDLIVVNRHDELTGPNVVVTRTALHRATPARLAAAADAWRPRFAHLRRPLVAVLVGGSNGRFRLDAAVAGELAGRLGAMMRDDAVGVAVTPSRRTDPAVTRVLAETLVPLGGHVWDGSGDNPYFGMLALADAIVVTMDSVSMISEAVATSAPVMLATLPGRSRRNSLFIEALAARWPGARVRRAIGNVAGDAARRHGGSRGRDVSPARPGMLNIQTFDNRAGGNVLYKALAHPLAAEAMARLYARLAGPVAVYDPEGIAAAMLALYPEAPPFIGLYVHDVTAVGEERAGYVARPLTELPDSGARVVLIAAFDAGRIAARIAHLLPPGAEVVTLDEVKLPDALLTNRARYLDKLNFATNFVFFRDADGLSTRLVSANYWAGYGGGAIRLWLRLFDTAGTVLATWEQEIPPARADFRSTAAWCASDSTCRHSPASCSCTRSARSATTW